MKLSALKKLIQYELIPGNPEDDPEILIDLDLGDFGSHELDIVGCFEFEYKLYLTTEVVQKDQK